MPISLVAQTTASSKTSGTTLVLTVPAGGFPVGSSVIVVLTVDSGGGVGSVTDSAGNTYVRDYSFAPSPGISVSIHRASNISALAAGVTITITFTAAITAKAANASCWQGLSLSPLDELAYNGGGDAAADSGLTAITTQADELVIGLVGIEGPTGDAFTPGATLIALTRVGTTGGAGTSNVTTNGLYKIVSATGQYKINGTLGTARIWGAICYTYKAVVVVVGISQGYIF